MAEKRSLLTDAGANKMNIITLAAMTLLGGNQVADFSFSPASKSYVDEQTGEIMDFLKCDKLDEDIPALQVELEVLRMNGASNQEIVAKTREIAKKQEQWITLQCTKFEE